MNNENYFIFPYMYWTPFNIYKEEGILKYDYDQGFEISKSVTFALKMHLQKATKEIKVKPMQGSNPWPTDC